MRRLGLANGLRMNCRASARRGVQGGVVHVVVRLEARHEAPAAVDVVVGRLAVHEGDAASVDGDHVGGEAAAEPGASALMSLAVSLNFFFVFGATNTVYACPSRRVEPVPFVARRSR
jgi:hypothetical protein